ncbi:hypothetical protein J6590_002845 [Homalodisca vitripennis]|nr:hypothetical protein J6590_002845 [Homalodisca vitripennis]
MNSLPNNHVEELVRVLGSSQSTPTLKSADCRILKNGFHVFEHDFRKKINQNIKEQLDNDVIHVTLGSISNWDTRPGEAGSGLLAQTPYNRYTLRILVSLPSQNRHQFIIKEQLDNDVIHVTLGSISNWDTRPGEAGSGLLAHTPYNRYTLRILVSLPSQNRHQFNIKEQLDNDVIHVTLRIDIKLGHSAGRGWVRAACTDPFNIKEQLDNDVIHVTLGSISNWDTRPGEAGSGLLAQTPYNRYTLRILVFNIRLSLISEISEDSKLFLLQKKSIAAGIKKSTLRSKL